MKIKIILAISTNLLIVKHQCDWTTWACPDEHGCAVCSAVCDATYHTCCSCRCSLCCYFAAVAGEVFDPGSNKPTSEKIRAVYMVAACTALNWNLADRSHALVAGQAPCCRSAVAEAPRGPQDPW